jgi:hypothetical protein
VVGGAVCIAVTWGAATPLVIGGIAAGVSAIAYGASEMAEGGQKICYGGVGDYTTAAFNPLRDTVFGGSQKSYDTFGVIATTSSTIMTLGAGGISAASLATTAAKTVPKVAAAKALGVYGIKNAAGFAAGFGGEYAGRKIATSLGADAYTADMAGIAGGVVGGMIGGLKAERFDNANNLSGYKYVEDSIPIERIDSKFIKDGKINWPENGGFDPNIECRGYFPQTGDEFSRYGWSGGRNVAPLDVSGKPYPHETFSLPYPEDVSQQRLYRFARPLDELPIAVTECTDPKLQMELYRRFGEPIRDYEVYAGVAAAWEDGSGNILRPGGAPQWKLPMTPDVLVALGMIEDITPYLENNMLANGVVEELFRKKLGD